MEFAREGVVHLARGADSPLVAELAQVDEAGEKQNRNPRWLQEETLVLVEAKRRQAEERLVSMPLARTLTADERWEAIAAFCNANSCERNAYQCRKRWFALSGDYNKVREWQTSTSESYWSVKADRRRENRLPGSFDQLVFSRMRYWLKKDPDVKFDRLSSRQDDGVSSEIEQDGEGQDLPCMTCGDGNSIPRPDQAGDLGDRRYRNPRWSLHELLILLAAKKKQDDDYGMASKARLRSITADERWETISAYCRTQGCERNAYQCRKRWSALLGDFKRIRDWQKISHETYWLMKNEKRKENKLPAIFDHEAFANMETWVGKRNGKKSGTEHNGLLDSAKPAQGLLSDVDCVYNGHLEPESALGGCQQNRVLPPEFGINGREETPSDSTVWKKRKHAVSWDSAIDCKGQQVAAVFKSSIKAIQVTLAENTEIQIQAHNKTIQAQIEAQNLNSELDRSRRKEHGESLVGVLGKLADALGRIAEKLV